MTFKRLFTTLLGIVINSCYCQAQESVFYTQDSLKSFNINTFGVAIYNLNFFKNNEYFNHLADGYTLLGTQIHPEFVYNHTKNTQFKAGIFLLKNFGEHQIDYSIPTFSFTYTKNRHLFTIGNLNGRNNHGVIEPLLASEKIVTNQVIETGLEYSYSGNRFSSSVWLDWENYIRKNDDFKEIFTVGISSKLQLTKHLFIPLQLITRHKGGQINKKFRDPNHIKDIYDIHNVALGAEFLSNATHKTRFKLSYYFLVHKTDAPVFEYPYANGTAHYFKIRYIAKHFQAMLAYYKANKFITARGNDMFNTYSLKVNNNYWEGEIDNRYLDLREPNRSFLFSKLFYQKELAKNIVLGLQAEGFLQLNESIDTVVTRKNTQYQFDYSYGVYVKFNDVFSF